MVPKSRLERGSISYRPTYVSCISCGVNVDAESLIYSSPTRATHPHGRSSTAHPNCISSPLAPSRQETRSPLHMLMSLNMMLRAYRIAVVGDGWSWPEDGHSPVHALGVPRRPVPAMRPTVSPRTSPKYPRSCQGSRVRRKCPHRGHHEHTWISTCVIYGPIQIPNSIILFTEIEINSRGRSCLMTATFLLLASS